MKIGATPARLAALGGLLLLFVLVVLWVLPSNTYIFLPDKAHPVAPIVQVQGGHDPRDGGGIYFVDIFVRKATLAERLWPGLHDGAQLVPANEVVPPGTTEQQRRTTDRREMSRSQLIAAAVALRALGHKVTARPVGVLVEQVDANVPAASKLRQADVILSANGKPVRYPVDLRRVVGALKPGDEVRLVVRRGSGQLTVTVKTTHDRSGRTVIGVLVDQAADIELPINVKIDAGNVGGPSAGLAFALDVLEELGRDVDHGHKIAATGQIELDGTIAPIGGIKQKTIGVRRTGILVFLVPAGENADEARRYANGVKIVPVKTFQQALRTLATLPELRQ
jgi:PDZ domain-containing protein